MIVFCARVSPFARGVVTAVRAMAAACASLAISGSLHAEFQPREAVGPSSRRTAISITEIQYAPVPRGDGRNLEFIELYNSNPFIEDLSGWELRGSVQFAFPSNSVLPGNSFLVVAAVPGDLAAVTPGLAPVGPWSGSLPDSGGHLQLVKR
mgnify:FL=1